MHQRRSVERVGSEGDTLLPKSMHVHADQLIVKASAPRTSSMEKGNGMLPLE